MTISIVQEKDIHPFTAGQVSVHITPTTAPGTGSMSSVTYLEP